MEWKPLQFADELSAGNQLTCRIRKKSLSFSPEEFVRQLTILYLNSRKNIPLSRMSIEKACGKAAKKGRYDLLIHDEYGDPWMLIECKSFRQPLKDADLLQAAIYGEGVGASYYLLTNGKSIRLYKKEKGMWRPLDQWPEE